MKSKAIGAAVALMLAACAVLASACGSSSSSSSGGGKPSGTLKVWDYYGSATPIKPAVRAFERLHPEIRIQYEALDYETMRDKFSVGVSGGSPPDLATLDMTWIPTYAGQGVLSDLGDLSDGDRLNGRPIGSQYTKGADAAMKYDGKRVAMLYDFDAYALYYRADQFQKKGIAVPRTWADLRAAAKQLTEGSGKDIRYAFQVMPDTFHFAQMLFQAGGSILNGDNTKAAFNSAQGVAGLTNMKGFLDDGTGIYWGQDQGDSTGVPGIKDGRLGMFLNGPYMMGVLKDSAPEQRGDWKVAPAPIDTKAGSYLGGTGLVVPVNAKNKPAAWEFAQFLLTRAQQVNVYKYAGAAPATVAALKSPALTKPDPYFGGQAPFSVFQEAQATATAFPYVKSWDQIDKAITDGVESALLGHGSPADALNKAASQTDDILAAG